MQLPVLEDNEAMTIDAPPITVLVTGSPTTSQAHHSALRFVRAAMSNQRTIQQVFFYQDAVTVASQFLCVPQDETQLTDEWVNLAKTHGFELQACVAAGNRRGVINDEEAKVNNKIGASIHPDFSVLGLGQLAAAMSQPGSKLIHFK